MAANGANLICGPQVQIEQAILKKLGLLPFPGNRTKTGPLDRAADALTTYRKVAVFYKAGVPATNTAADAPSGFGDLCYDSTNDDIYRCTAYTNTSTFTWTKMVD